jgi:hypothetical protein
LAEKTEDQKQKNHVTHLAAFYKFKNRKFLEEQLASEYLMTAQVSAPSYEVKNCLGATLSSSEKSP